MSINQFSAANAHFCHITEPSGRGRIQETTSPLGDGNFNEDITSKLFKMIQVTTSPLGDGNSCQSLRYALFSWYIGYYFPVRGRKHLLQPLLTSFRRIYRLLLPRQGTETLHPISMPPPCRGHIGYYFPVRGRKLIGLNARSALICIQVTTSPLGDGNTIWAGSFSRLMSFIQVTTSPLGDGNCSFKPQVVFLVFRYRLLLPRQGTETSAC